MFIVIAFDNDRDVVWLTAKDTVQGCKDAAELWCASVPLVDWENEWQERWHGEVFQYGERVANSEDSDFGECYYLEMFCAD